MASWKIVPICTEDGQEFYPRIYAQKIAKEGWLKSLFCLSKDGVKAVKTGWLVDISLCGDPNLLADQIFGDCIKIHEKFWKMFADWLDRKVLSSLKKLSGIMQHEKKVVRKFLINARKVYSLQNILISMKESELRWLQSMTVSRKIAIRKNIEVLQDYRQRKKIGTCKQNYA